MEFTHNFYEMNEKEFYNIIDYYKNKIYLYHFIIFVYEDNYIKVDNIDDLNKINTSGLISKYYIKKIHFLMKVIMKSLSMVNLIIYMT